LKAQRFIPLLFVVVGFLAYYNSLHCPFIFDDLHISENPYVGQLRSPWALLTHSSRPVVLFSLAVNYALGGRDPWGYHLFNVGVHILASLTLYGLIRRTLVSRTLRAKWGPVAAPVAATIALIWLVHPLQTESVTYTIQRSESLMGLFYLLTFYCVIRSTSDTPVKRWQMSAVVSCALGMASKPVMVTAPVLVLLYDRLFLVPSWREVRQQRGMMYAGLAATWLLLVLVLRDGRGDWKQTAGFAFAGITPAHYALMQPAVILHYIRLAFWPDPLCLDYGWTYGGAPAQTVKAAWPGLLVVSGLLGATVWALRRNPPLGFLGAWFFIILAPTSSFIPLADPIFEHRMYLPLVAVVTITVLGAYQLSVYLQRSRTEFGNVLRWILAGSVVLTLAGLTVRRNLDYASELTIWQDTVEKRPNNPRAHNNLAIALGQAGRVGEAIGHYEQALRIKPDYVEARNNLGVVLGELGRFEDSIGQLEQVLQVAPDYPEAHYNLGLALYEVGKVREAVEQYELALRIRPDYARAHYHLGIALEQTGRIREAIEHYEQALRIKPDYTEARYNLDRALNHAGNAPAQLGH